MYIYIYVCTQTQLIYHLLLWWMDGAHHFMMAYDGKIFVSSCHRYLFTYIYIYMFTYLFGAEVSKWYFSLADVHGLSWLFDWLADVSGLGWLFDWLAGWLATDLISMVLDLSKHNIAEKKREKHHLYHLGPYLVRMHPCTRSSGTNASPGMVNWHVSSLRAQGNNRNMVK